MKAKNNKAEKSLVFDRVLVVVCTILVIVSCISTVYIVYDERNNQDTEVVELNPDMSEEDYKKLIDITARYTGEECFSGTYVDKKSIKVYGKLSDGTRKELTSWDAVLGPVREGSNTFTITYRDFSTQLKVTGVSLNTVTSATNYNLYAFDEAAAKRLVSNIKNGNSTYDEAFEGVLLCGDSRTKAIITCQTLKEEKILAENGVGLEHLDLYMPELLSRNPETIILNYGVNSISEVEEARDEFVQKYRELIVEIKQALPQTRIIVAAIFPVSAGFADEQPRMYYIDTMNLELFKMCVELGIEFIDGTDIIYDNSVLLNPDGLHFTETFYKQYWLQELIEKMGIGVVEPK